MAENKQIPTAEELMLQYIPNGIQNIKGSGDGKPQYRAEVNIITKCMREFAALAVKYTLEQAAENAHVEDYYDSQVIDKQSILSLEEEIIKTLGI